MMGGDIEPGRRALEDESSVAFNRAMQVRQGVERKLFINRFVEQHPDTAAAIATGSVTNVRNTRARIRLRAWKAFFEEDRQLSADHLTVQEVAARRKELRNPTNVAERILSRMRQMPASFEDEGTAIDEDDYHDLGEEVGVNQNDDDDVDDDDQRLDVDEGGGEIIAQGAAVQEDQAGQTASNAVMLTVAEVDKYRITAAECHSDVFVEAAQSFISLLLEPQERPRDGRMCPLCEADSTMNAEAKVPIPV